MDLFAIAVSTLREKCVQWGDTQIPILPIPPKFFSDRIKASSVPLPTM